MRADFALLLLMVAVMLPTALHAAPMDDHAGMLCPSAPIRLSPADSPEVALVCRAATRARDFFRAHGIEIQQPIRIRLQRNELSNHANHIGLYDAREQAIRMVTLDHASNHCNEAPPFEVQMDAALYASFVSHEVAHATTSQNAADSIALLAHEYLAYVTQFATMPADARERILQRFDVAGFGGIDELSLTYYQLNPNLFGIKAYRHYQSQQDKSGLIRDLISGAIAPNSEPSEWW